MTRIVVGQPCEPIGQTPIKNAFTSPYDDGVDELLLDRQVTLCFYGLWRSRVHVAQQQAQESMPIHPGSNVARRVIESDHRWPSPPLPLDLAIMPERPAASNRPLHPPPEEPAVLAKWQRTLHEIIFEAETPAGKAFDVALLIAILLSVAAVMLDSVGSIASQWGTLLGVIEWTITILFTIEYVLRLCCVRRPWRYALSFFGIVDLLAILPSYLSFFVQGSHALATIRTLRLIRVFRVFKMGRHTSEANTLLKALRQTRPKITVFVSVVGCAIIILGTLMYLLERDQDSGFDSIPRSVYWAIVTMTTVGYGDIAPQTVTGQTLAAVIMLLGYAIIVVPTGIFSAEVISARTHAVTTQTCPHCSREGHDLDARHCKYCGGVL